MSHCLILPDCHLKVALLDRATELLLDHPDWRCISLGDWADDWGRPVSDYRKFFEALEEFLVRFTGRVSSCWGNHDYGYYDYPAHCSGYSYRAEHIVKDFYRGFYEEDLMSAFPQVAIEIDNVYFSHAGITEGLHRYYKSCCHRYPGHSFMEWINGILVSNPRRLWDECSPLWHRPANNYHKNTFNPHYLQVVGHTPVPTVTYSKEDNILYTDTWSTDSERKPLGDKSLVLVDTITKEWEIIREV